MTPEQWIIVGLIASNVVIGMIALVAISKLATLTAEVIKVTDKIDEAGVFPSAPRRDPDQFRVL